MIVTILLLLAASIGVAHVAAPLRALLTAPLSVMSQSSNAAQGWVASATGRLWAAATGNWQLLRGTGPGALVLAGIVGGAGLCLIVAGGEFSIHALALRLQLHPPVSGAAEPGPLTPAEAALPAALVATSIVVGAFVLERFGLTERSLLPREPVEQGLQRRRSGELVLGWVGVAILVLTFVVNIGFGVIRYGEAVDSARVAASTPQSVSIAADDVPSLLADDVGEQAVGLTSAPLGSSPSPNSFAYLSAYVLLPALLAASGVLVGWSLLRLFVVGAVAVTGGLAGVTGATGWSLATLARLLEAAVDKAVPVAIDLVAAPGRGLWNFAFRPPHAEGAIARWRPGPVPQDGAAIQAVLVARPDRTEHVPIDKGPVEGGKDPIVTVAGRFEARLWAEGQFTRVYVATDRENPGSGEVVLKTAKPLAQPTSRSTAVTVVRTEADYLARIDSDHVVDLVDFIDGDDPVIVLRRYPYDLDAYLRKHDGVLPFGWAFDVVGNLLRGACDIYDQLHASHCDLKDLNVLVDEGGGCVICDLGAATKQDALLQSGLVGGTNFWRSPEQQALLSGWAAPWTDVWGIGALITRIFGGTPPYVREAATRGRVSYDRWAALMLKARVDPSALVRQPLRELDDRYPASLDDLVGQFLSIEPCARVPGVSESAALREALSQWSAVVDDHAHLRGQLLQTGSFPEVEIVHSDRPADDAA